MFCKYCAAELEDGSNFCAMCGKPQQAQAVAPRDDDGARGLLVCVNCGKALERGWTLCPYCGTKVNVVPADEATPKIVDEPLADGKLEPEKAGLYDGNEYRGPLDILDSIDWITLNGKDGGNYLIVLGKDEAIPYAILDFEGKHVSVTLKTLGPECTVQRAGPFDKPLFEVGSGVTFTLEAGVALVGVSGNKASVVVVKKDGTFIMNGGSISGNSSEGNGGGVYVSGTFTMNGGTISRNSTQYNVGGGGVYVSDGTFTMSGGTISGNSTKGNGGGGVYVKDGTFTMSGGTISGNSDSGQGGGGVSVSGTFIMSGGTISGNSTKGNGGGVEVYGTFTMSGGTISGNSAYAAGAASFLVGGGGVYVKGTFTMSGGTISGNSTKRNGGGVYVSGTFTMNDGSISGNSAQDGGYSNGGGVYVTETFTMNDGSISGNFTNGEGGGVYVIETFTMSGGTISGNSAKGTNYNSDGRGGGVYVTSDWRFISSRGKFMKGKGSVIYGSNAPAEQANTAKHGAAVFCNTNKRDTTARAGTLMDSEKRGTEGGWE